MNGVRAVALGGAAAALLGCATPRHVAQPIRENTPPTDVAACPRGAASTLHPMGALPSPFDAPDLARRVAPEAPQVSSSLPSLVTQLRSSPFDIWADVPLAIGAIGGPDAVAPLVETLSVPRAQIAGAAADALASMGSDACSALPALRAAREHWSLDVRWKVARAISTLEGGPISPAAPAEPRVSSDELIDRATVGRAQAAALPPDPAGCLVPIGDECIVGGSMGEWGGMLDVVPRKRLYTRGDAFTRTKRGVWQLLPWGDGALAITRMDHFMRWPGQLVVMRRHGSDGWGADVLVELPGYPIAYRLLADEVVVVVEETMGPTMRVVLETAFGIDASGRVRRSASAEPSTSAGR